MKLTCLGSFILASLLLPAPPASAATLLYVATEGDDGNEGTADAPFATPARAQQAVRGLIARGLRDHVVVELQGGLYTLLEPLVFSVSDGGTQQFSVTWQAARGERVAFTGGIPIEGWTAIDEGLWQAPLPALGREWQFRELFVNGQRRPRARHPDSGFLRAFPLGSEQRTAFRTVPDSFPPLASPFEAELVFLHDWSISRIPLIQADSSDGIVRLAAPVGAAAAQFALFNFEASPRFLLENDRAFLDTPGEWFLDSVNQTLLYRPMASESPDTLNAVAPFSPALITVRGDDASGRPVQNLHFKGIDFEHAAWQRPLAGYTGIQATFYEIRPSEQKGEWSLGPVPAAVSFEIAENCSVTDGSLRHLGGSGLSFGSRCRNCTAARLLIQDVSANGINIGEGRARQIAGQLWWNVAPEQVATDNVVHDCLVERCGAQFFGGIGIWAGITAGTVIERNWIRDLPYTGISVGWVWEATPTPARDNIVRVNRIERIMQLLSDGGGVYTLGNQPGMIIGGNVISSIPPAIGRAESNGLFLDEGSTGLTIEANVIFNVAMSPLRFHRAGSNRVRNNALAVSQGVPPVRYNNTPEDQIILQDNTILAADQFDPQRIQVTAGPRADILPTLEARSRD